MANLESTASANARSGVLESTSNSIRCIGACSESLETRLVAKSIRPHAHLEGSPICPSPRSNDRSVLLWRRVPNLEYGAGRFRTRNSAPRFDSAPGYRLQNL